jgi:hypothetical protein
MPVVVEASRAQAEETQPSCPKQLPCRGQHGNQGEPRHADEQRWSVAWLVVETDAAFAGRRLCAGRCSGGRSHFCISAGQTWCARGELNHLGEPSDLQKHQDVRVSCSATAMDNYLHLCRVISVIPWEHLDPNRPASPSVAPYPPDYPGKGIRSQQGHPTLLGTSSTVRGQPANGAGKVGTKPAAPCCVARPKRQAGIPPRSRLEF